MNVMNSIKDIILLQKQELEKKQRERYVTRESRLKTKTSLIQVIIGPRRAGKSFFAVHSLKDTFGYVNFDDERLATVRDYDEIVTAVNAVYQSPHLLLFDEIQNLSKWELFVNRLQRQGYQLVITGSNSKMLSRELATHLTGRHLLTELLTFSFREYLHWCKEVAGRELTAIEIREKLSQYLLQGGFPEPVIKNYDVKEYILTLYDSIIYKDIVKRYHLRLGKQVEDLAFYLLSNIGSEYSYHSLAKGIGLKSQSTVQKYVGFLEEAFIIFTLQRFSYKVKEQISSNKKAYCYDNGLISAKAFSASPTWGKLYENIVARELLSQETYYWKNSQQEEVDFVIKQGLKFKELIQVCFNLENLKTKQRELRALVKASQELKCDRLLVITAEQEGEEVFGWYGVKKRIAFIPLWKWLLEKA